jgi:hypothetical protein
MRLITFKAGISESTLILENDRIKFSTFKFDAFFAFVSSSHRLIMKEIELRRLITSFSRLNTSIKSEFINYFRFNQI